jgi:hypothetical protein
MTEHPSNRKPLSPLERLENITDALFADELLETEFEAEDAERGDAVIRAAINEALGVAPIPASQADINPSENRGDSSAPRPISSSPTLPTSRDAPLRWFAKTFGLQPIAAAVLTALNLMFSVAAPLSLGGSFFFEVPLAPIICFIVYITEKKWYGSSSKSAWVKALIATVLTELPLPVFAGLFVAAGIVGFFRRKPTATQAKQEDVAKKN